MLAVARRWGVLPGAFDALPRETQAELVADYRIECDDRNRAARLAKLRRGSGR